MLRRIPSCVMALVVGVAGACRPAVDAPDDVEGMAVFGFVHFQQPDHVDAVALPMFDWSLDEHEALADGYAVDALTADDLADVGVDEPDIQGIIGALGRATYVSDPVRVAEGVSHPHKDALYAGTLAFEVTAEDGDRDCFLARTCASYAYTAIETSTVPVLGQSVRTIRSELQWVDTTAGAEVFAMRQLVPEPTDFTTPLLAIDQQYGFTLVRATDTGSERLETFWVDAKVIGLELPEGFAVHQAVGRMQASADDLDAWFAAQDGATTP